MAMTSVYGQTMPPEGCAIGFPGQKLKKRGAAENWHKQASSRAVKQRIMQSAGQGGKRGEAPAGARVAGMHALCWHSARQDAAPFVGAAPMGLHAFRSRGAHRGRAPFIGKDACRDAAPRAARCIFSRPTVRRGRAANHAGTKRFCAAARRILQRDSKREKRQMPPVSGRRGKEGTESAAFRSLCRNI